MPTGVCPSAAELLVTALSLGLLMAFVAGMVGHGILRPLLEARGVSPWRVRDSLGSLPLVLLGSALIGGTGTLLALWGVTACEVAGWVIALVSCAMIVAVLMVRLGLLALQKLT